MCFGVLTEFAGARLADANAFDYALAMLRDEQLPPEQIRILRAMSGEKRLRLAEQLYWSARRMKAAGIRNQHPDWSDQRIEAEVTRIFLYARS